MLSKEELILIRTALDEIRPYIYSEKLDERLERAVKLCTRELKEESNG